MWLIKIGIFFGRMCIKIVILIIICRKFYINENMMENFVYWVVFNGVVFDLM